MAGFEGKTRREILTNGDYRKIKLTKIKWQILGGKGKFRQKWRVCQKVIEASANYSNKMTKRGILTNSKLQIWQEFIGLAKIKTK